MGFSRQGYGSGVPFPSLWQMHPWTTGFWRRMQWDPPLPVTHCDCDIVRGEATSLSYFLMPSWQTCTSALFFFFFSCALENCPGQIGPTIFQPYLVISLSSHISHNSRSEKGQKVLTGRGPLLFTPLGLLNMFKVCSLLCKSFPEVRRSLPYNSSAGSLSQQIPGEAECLLTWFLSSTLASSEGCFASFFITSWAMCKVTNHPG